MEKSGRQQAISSIEVALDTGKSTDYVKAAGRIVLITDEGKEHFGVVKGFGHDAPDNSTVNPFGQKIGNQFPLASRFIAVTDTVGDPERQRITIAQGNYVGFDSV